MLQFQAVNFIRFDEMYIIGMMRFQSALYLPEAYTQYSNGTGAQFNAKSSFLRSQYDSLGEDVWGNIRIPHTFSLPWLAVPDDQIVNYTSLIGIPFGSRPSKFVGNISFVMNSSHHRFKVRFPRPLLQRTIQPSKAFHGKAAPLVRSGKP